MAGAGVIGRSMVKLKHSESRSLLYDELSMIFLVLGDFVVQVAGIGFVIRGLTLSMCAL